MNYMNKGKSCFETQYSPVASLSMQTKLRAVALYHSPIYKRKNHSIARVVPTYMCAPALLTLLVANARFATQKISAVLKLLEIWLAFIPTQSLLVA